MAQISNCLKLISKIDERDQDALVARLDELQAQGVPAERAQIQAAIDVLAAVQRDSSESNQAPALTSKARSAIKSGATDTPEFKRWFGDSKVVDADGKPLVVYHGGRAGTTKFRDGNQYRPGIFFTDSKHVADAFGVAGDTYPVYLKADRLFQVDAGGAYYSEIPRPKEMEGFTGREEVETDLIAEWAFQNGYDGVQIQGVLEGRGNSTSTVYIVPQGKQIKSATGNNGAFDPRDANITRSASRQTETPEFKAWFKDSKVVGAQGDPLVVYHATTSDIKKFSTKKSTGGFYFTPNAEEAYPSKRGAMTSERGLNVMPVYLSITNPLRTSDPGDWHQLDAGLRSSIEARGFDGVIVENDDGSVREYIAFEPGQIKSATGNIGAFDPADANITRSISRDTYAWRESIDTSVGPLLQGDDFYLLPQREITQDDFGNNGFAANGLMGHAERAVPGTRTIAYRIVGNNGIIGTLVSDVDPAGVVRSVHDIEITDRRGGIGSKVIATIAANAQPPIKIQDITDEADPFWTRIGVGYKDQYGDAFLDWDDVAQYLGARRAAQVDPDAAPAAGRDRGLQEGSYEVSELSPDEAADFFKFSKDRVTRPEFYSQLQRSIEQVPDRLASMAAPQWKLWLDANAPKLGVKKDEIEWSGVKDYLTLRGKDKVTRDELVAYLSDSGVRVQEVVLGYEPPLVESYYIVDHNDGTYDVRSGSGSDAVRNFRSRAEAQNWIDEKQDDEAEAGDNREFETKYAAYTVPGGENYREVLITLPGAETSAQRLARWKKKYPEWKEGQSFKAVMTEPDQAKFLAELDGTKSDYRSSHWDQPNILAHLRVDDRVDADGARVLFINELQSDFGQDYRKAKDAIERAVDDDFQGIVDRMKKAGVLEVVCD